MSDLSDKREAGAIEVTPEMIEAVAEELSWWVTSEGALEDVARAVCRVLAAPCGRRK